MFPQKQSQNPLSGITKSSEINVIDLTQQNSDMALVETLRQQTAGVIDTIMEEILPKPVKEGSTFHSDFDIHSYKRLLLIQPHFFFPLAFRF